MTAEMNDIEIGVIGLGKFGLEVGRTLVRLGAKCIGLDISPARAAAARNDLTQVYQADATDREALVQLNFQSLETVVVAVGGRLEAGILTCLNLLELEIPNLVVKASSPLHKKVLERMGVGRIIQPEIEVASYLAHSLVTPGLLDLLPIGKGVVLEECVVDKWAGLTLRSLNLRNENKVLVAAIQERGEGAYKFVPDPDRPLEAGDKLLFIGYKDNMDRVRKET